ncbi:hypothetical protein HK099_003874 [Clydaea vesicula]|uniref:Uncharacterized protein n=1 Tax=Clydaea vesicula TaxID=447962 RepID=A0AAD5UA66_9FUNG|nr:hypothetical protein HK099_003874 [Clydaea vesicula]
MIQRGTYSFKSEEENEFNLEGYEFIVKLSSVDNTIARLYLVNQNKVQVDVPANISLRNFDENTAPNHFQNSFFIAWVNSYALLIWSKNSEHRTYINGVLIPPKKRRAAVVVEVEDDEE